MPLEHRFFLLSVGYDAAGFRSGFGKEI